MFCKNWPKGLLAALTLAGCFALSAAAAHVGVATVRDEGLPLRAQPGLSGEIMTQAHKGQQVTVLEQAGDWYKVDCATQVGYMSAAFLQVSTSVEADLGYGMVTTGGDPLNLRAGAGTDADRLTTVPSRAVLPLIGFQEGWYKTTYNGLTGYVSSDYITPVQDAAGTRADDAIVTASDLGQRIVDEAMKHLGKPYVYGGKGPNGFDCSGFVYYCVKEATGGSIVLSGGASNQWLTAPGQRVNSIDQLQPGDLLFINDPAYGSPGKPVSHVSIYMGNGQIIHASDGRTGVIAQPLRDKDYRYFVGAIRLG